MQRTLVSGSQRSHPSQPCRRRRENCTSWIAALAGPPFSAWSSITLGAPVVLAEQVEEGLLDRVHAELLVVNLAHHELSLLRR